MYQRVTDVVLSLQVLKMVKCCIAAGCIGTYSDNVGVFQFHRDDNGASKFGKI